jgi:hypothetical protein
LKSQHAAQDIVAFYLRRMFNDASRCRQCSVEELFAALHYAVARALARKQKPKHIGRQAAKLARQYRRSLVKKRKAKRFLQFDDLAQPQLRLISTEEEG